MGGLSFDTSGAVPANDNPRAITASEWRWIDLLPFEQGYIEALFASVPYLGTWTCRRCGWSGAEPDTAPTHFATAPGYGLKAPLCPPCGQYFAESDFPVWTFSDLAPETLAAIRKDCAAANDGKWLGYRDTAGCGAMFWKERQQGFLNGDGPKFPPLTVSLGDDGKVYLREAG